MQGNFNLTGTVIGILSGDSLIVHFDSYVNQHQIQIVSLEHLVAPKFGSPDGQIQDEPHGFESWNFMRDLCIGKSVFIMPQQKKNELYRSHPAFGRLGVIFGRIFLCDMMTQQQYDVGLYCVFNGWVKIRAPPNVNARYIQSLLNGEQRAKSEGLGIWRQHGFKRSLPVPFDAKKLISISEFDAIVDSVVNGTTLSLFLLPDHQHIIFRVAACRSPSAKKDSTNAYGTEAKDFTIRELLHRSLRVRLCSVNEADLFIGPILSKEDSAIRHLISSGLALFNVHTAELTPSAYEYERCEAEAKAQNLKIFEDYEKTIEQEYITFEGVVRQIVGSVALRIDVHGETRLVQFSCIKTRDFIAGGGSELLGFETREFIRNYLIGRTVTVKVDGIIEGRCYGTVYLGDVCMNVLICQEGFANVIEPFIGRRSEMFDQMIIAENNASSHFLGIFQRGLMLNLPNVIDLSLTIYPEYSLKYFPELAQGRLNGIIEQILGGNRFIVLVQHRFLLRLAVNGLLPISPSDIHGRNATNYSIENYLNREIEFDIHEVDKSGGFLANMSIVGVNQQYLNIAYDLLLHGFAEVHKRTVKDIPNYEALERAQEQAKEQKIGKWGESKSSRVQLEFGKYYSIKIIEVLSTNTFIVQFLYETMKEIVSVLPSATTPVTEIPNIGDFVCALIDGNRYRARVETNYDSKSIKLVLIDYDEPAEASLDQIFELPPRLLSIEPQAATVRLAFIEEDRENDEFSLNNIADREYIENLTKDKRLFMYIAYFTDIPEVLLLDKSEIDGGNLNSMVLYNTNVHLVNTEIDIHTEFKPVILRLKKYQSMKSQKPQPR
ncbi:ebna2 binding protein P100 [Tritrichomonas foetus]|uniref:Ebna2 binding protein P100 n=1 Tax=Tritrichomonas foetus TaxID=1144522 RepID=A0A1J4J331_9EUKA|nr:ebna2 binding protein P100 [Tritrichomonas foetus]|eukprot:OHS93830.1 ebna2 binding protein P100 [Tritrichomonas foetus]